MKNLICPNSETCKIYKLYQEKTIAETNIIQVKIEDDKYFCNALQFTTKPQEQSHQIDEKNQPTFECALIEILNNQKKILHLSGNIK